MRQGNTPFHLLQLTEIPRLQPEATETTNPNLPVPVYYIHSVARPFCQNPLCKCQWQQKEVMRLLGNVVEGEMILQEAAHFLDDLKRGEQ